MQRELKEKDPEVPAELPILTTTETIVYPYTVVPLAVSEKSFSLAVDEAMSKDRMIGIFGAVLKDETSSELTVFPVGTAAVIHKLLKLPDGSIRIIVQGWQRSSRLLSPRRNRFSGHRLRCFRRMKRSPRMWKRSCGR